jgi:hypothetical protein
MSSSLRSTTLRPSYTSTKYLTYQALPQLEPESNKTLALSGFVVQAMASIPTGVHLQPGMTKVSWLDVECGRWAQFEGAAELYAECPRGVIALVTQEARLHLFDGEGCIRISAGLWRVSPPE